MIKILANDGISDDGKLLLEEAGFFVETQKIPQEKLPHVINQYDVLIVRSATQVRKPLIDAAPNLKLIARAGVGLDNIDADYARSHGMEVINTPAASSQSVAELVFGHIFNLARFIHRSNRELQGGDFKKLKNDFSDGLQVRGKTLGIVGFGRIGQASARIGMALGMKVLATDPYVNAADIRINILVIQDVSLSVNIETIGMQEVLQRSDFITFHVPGTDKPLIGRAEMAGMKRGVFLINTARGGSIDEEALLEALESGQVGGAGLDVFEGEPTPRPELLNHPRISVTPHIGASTLEAQANIGLELAETITNFFSSK
jgi:D-3-phosphoglycerate dehydrogenase